MVEINTRKIFFWLLALFFIFTALLVIFYTLGYRFNFKRGIFVYTGAVTVKSIPKKVSIFIDDEPISNKRTNYLNNSYHVNGIKPQSHLIEARADGYTTWFKKAAVHSGVSTEFWNVLLTKENYSPEKYSAYGIEKFFISPKGKKIAYTQNEKDSGEFLVKMLDIETGLSENIFSSLEYKFSADDTENIEWSPQARKIIIPVQEEGGKYYFIIDIENKQAVNFKDIVPKKEMRDVRWDPSSKDFLFYLAEKNLHRLNLKNPEENNILAQNIAGYDLSSSDIFYLQSDNGIIYKADLKNGKSEKQITASPINGAENDGFRVIAYDEKRIAVISNDKKLYVYNDGDNEKYFNQPAGEILGVQFSNDGKKLLYWTAREIFVYFTRDWDVQPARMENETKLITRFSRDIKNIQWSKKYEHIILSAENVIKIIELDRRDHRNTMDIVKLNGDNSQVIANFSENKLYFTDTNESFSNLYSIEFPDKNGFLGR